MVAAVADDEETPTGGVLDVLGAGDRPLDQYGRGVILGAEHDS